MAVPNPLGYKIRSAFTTVASSAHKIQILPVCLLRLLLVHAQIVLTGGVEPLVSENLLDVDNRTAIENEIGGHRVSQNVGGELLVDPGELSVPGKEAPYVVSIEPGHGPLGHKNRVIVVLSPF